MLRFLPGLLISIVSLSAQADSIGFEVGGGYWDANFSGDVIADVSIDSELNIDSAGSTYIYAHIEHPIPFFPNLRIAQTNIDESGTGLLSTNFLYEGASFIAGQSVASSVDLSHTDVTLYYELIDLGMDLDLGLTARYLEGEVSLGNVTESAEIILPMVYLRGKFNLPFTGTYLGGQINAASYSGDSIMDADVKIGWQTENFIFPEFGVEAGYRRLSIDADESVLIDLQADGVFMNLTAHF
ncbi:MAG: outer membrane protein [Candidatus Azotimanducaceae bacterium]